MKKIAIAMAVLMVALIAAPNTMAWATIDTVETLISIGTVSAEPGEHVAIPVQMSNNAVEISSMVIPLQFNPGSFNVDSISYDGTIQSYNIFPGHFIDNVSGVIRITFIPDFVSPLPSIFLQNVAVATIHLTVNTSATPGIKAIDSVNYSGVLIDTVITISTDEKDTTIAIYEIPVRDRIQMSDETGLTTYLPQFESGGVEVIVSTGIEDGNGSGNLPTAFALAQNYPNPFNPSTTIEYALPTASRVQIEVFNVLGQSVAMLVDENKPAGTHQVEFDASSQPSGMFFYRITHAQGSLTKKMILVK